MSDPLDKMLAVLREESFRAGGQAALESLRVALERPEAADLTREQVIALTKDLQQRIGSLGVPGGKA